MALTFPATEEGPFCGATAFRVRGMVFARFRDEDTVFAVKCGDSERDLRTRDDAAAFFVTEAYRGHPTVLVRLEMVREQDLREVLEAAWLRVASKRLRTLYLPQGGGPRGTRAE
jgi:hypothetical protein